MPITAPVPDAAALRRVADCREHLELADGRHVIICPVDPTDAHAEQLFVTEGLSAGQQVVTDGGDKLADGIKVDVHTNTENNSGGRRKQA